MSGSLRSPEGFYLLPVQGRIFLGQVEKAASAQVFEPLVQYTVFFCAVLSGKLTKLGHLSIMSLGIPFSPLQSQQSPNSPSQGAQWTRPVTLFFHVRMSNSMPLKSLLVMKLRAFTLHAIAYCLVQNSKHSPMRPLSSLPNELRSITNVSQRSSCMGNMALGVSSLASLAFSCSLNVGTSQIPLCYLKCCLSCWIA